MNIHKVLRFTVLTLFLGLFVGAPVMTVRAQAPGVPQADARTNEDETNLDTQLYLIVATNQDVVDDRLPAALDGVIKQLRASLPFKNYRLAATLVNRVKNDGRLNLRWIGGPFVTPTGSATAATP